MLIAPGLRRIDHPCFHLFDNPFVHVKRWLDVNGHDIHYGPMPPENLDESMPLVELAVPSDGGQKHDQSLSIPRSGIDGDVQAVFTLHYEIQCTQSDNEQDDEDASSSFHDAALALRS